MNASPVAATCSAAAAIERTALIEAGVAHHLAGRFAQAAGLYARALATDPGHAPAWRLLGVVGLQTGNLTEARRFLTAAIAGDPQDALAYSALGDVEQSAGDLDAAHDAYAAAHARDPALPAAAAGLLRTLLRLDRPHEAAAAAQAVLARGECDGAVLRAAGAALYAAGHYRGAVEVCEAALRAAPHPDAYANMAAAYLRLQRNDAAIAAAEAALALAPEHAEALNTIGIARKAAGDFGAALRAFARAAALGLDDGHLNLGTTRLLLGDEFGGWPEYGWDTAHRRANPLFGTCPLWDGAPLAGARVLIWPEQGIGDTIQMVRFVEQARARGAALTLACPPGTAALFATLAGVDACIPAEPAPRSECFDRWLPAVRLPVVFDVRAADVPNAPYLRADPARIARFRAHLPAPAATLRVGVVWSGSPEFAWNDIRSCGLAALEPLREIDGVTFIALQQGAARSDAVRSALPLLPLNELVHDFADTAAIVAQLDVVITVDTSVAHLTGALGKPGWVLLSDRPDWRWQRTGDTTPWYPTLRLFRQSGPARWRPVIAAVAAALRDAVAAHRMR